MIDRRLKELKHLAPSMSVARRLAIQTDEMGAEEFEALLEELARRKKDEDE